MINVKVIKLSVKVKNPILACGADMKGAFALAYGDAAFLVDGFGDLGDPDNLAKYERSVRGHIWKLGVRPVIIACDLHPDYFSTGFAENYALSDRDSLSKFHRYKLIKVQHHEAHIASAIIDGNVKGDVIGVAFDGTGFGPDGNIWGGEFFTGGLKGFRRAAHLEYIAMPGGEKAVTEPWRMAASYIYGAFGNRLPELSRRWRPKDLAVLKAMIDKKINTPLTSSAGRLFDAASSLILSKDSVSKEAELPIELEGIVDRLCCDRYDFDMAREGGELIISCKNIIKSIVKDLAGKVDASIVSGKFHNTIAEIILKVSLKLRDRTGIYDVVLTGGVFQNRFLAARTIEILTASGLKVHTHSGVPVNDSGIPIGQIAIANARSRV